MAIFELATQQGLSAWTQRVELDGVAYSLEFAWNERDGAWFISLAQPDGTPLVSGLKLVTNRPLLRRFRYRVGLPPGELYAIDLSGKIAYAGFSDLSNGVTITYYDASEGAP